MKNIIYITILSQLLVSCATTKEAENIVPLIVDYSWQKHHECSTVSPLITIDGLPEGVVDLIVKMTDLDSPNYAHGGGTVAYTGTSAIEEGALNKYKGPCPPSVHRYVIRVEALDASGLIIARGKKMQKYPSQ